jgi:ATP:corrinoid adenosyltransferase
MKEQLGSEWSIIHGLSIMAPDANKKMCEIDLMIIGPRGFYCLEIKGGHFRVLPDGRYEISYDGNSIKQRENPFDQASGAFYEVLKFVQKAIPRAYNECACGWGVIAPETVFNPENSPTYIREATFDARDYDTLDPYRQFVKRLAMHYERKMEAKGKRSRQLTRDEVDRVVNDLLAIGMNTPNRQLQAQVWQTEKNIDELTKTQASYLRKTVTLPRMIVTGGAGTGKTYLAMELCRQKVREGKRVLYCCFSKALAEDVSRHLSSTCKEKVNATTFHSCMVSAIRSADLMGKIDPNLTDASLFGSVFPQLFPEAVERLGDQWKYDVLVVDESQDLLWDHNKGVFESMVKGGMNGGSWYFFLDPFQRVFGDSNTSMMGCLRANSSINYSLDENCRNTIQIGDEYRALSGVNVSDHLRIEGADVTTINYGNEGELVTKLWQEIRRVVLQGVNPEGVVVITKTQNSWDNIVDGRPGDLGFGIAKITSGQMKGEMTIATYRLFKGLEAQVVFLVGVDDLDSEMDFLYVGGSRAKSKLVILMNSSQKILAEKRKREYFQSVAMRGN